MSGADIEQPNENGGCEETKELAKDALSLRDDLTRIFRYGFNFEGKFAFSMTMPYGPNPCLHIDGIGIVGLPLSDRDANLIANVGTSASERTAHNSTLVDCSKVSFKNPRWELHVDEVVRKYVLEKLGCAPCKTPPRCEFRNLLLQKPGDRLFTSTSIETRPGAFATVIIILPSEFAGGEIQASHGGDSLTLESTTGPLYETVLLAWYTNTNHEAENLTSGNRLALVYNLIHTSAGILPPCIPNDDALINRAREVFRGWVSSSYEGMSDDHVAAYVFDEGDRVRDDDVLSALKAVADAENIVLVLGTLCVHAAGWAGASTSEQPPYGLSQGTFEDPIMGSLYTTKFKVKNLTDIRGKPARNGFRLILGEDNLVPEVPFSGIEPDRQQAHPFAGEGDAPLEYWYDRSVLVLFPSSKQLNVLLASGGVPYALTELEKSLQEGPTKENQKIEEFIFQNWRETSPEYYVFDIRPSYEVPTMPARETAPKLLSIAVQCDDAELWVRTMNVMCKFEDEIDLGRFGLEHIVAGWEKFRLGKIEAALDRIMDGLQDVQGTLMLLNAFQNSESVSFPEARRDQWLSEHLDRSFTRKADESALPSIMGVIRSKGLDYVSRLILPPLLSQSLGVPFWAHTVELLHGSEDLLLELPPSQGQTLSNQELFESVLDDIQEVMGHSNPHPLVPLTDSDSDSDSDSE